MAETPSKIHYPTNADDFDPAGDMEQIARTVSHIVPVANATERNAIEQAFNPSPDRPLYVDRADTGALERNNGSGWSVLARAGASPFAVQVVTGTVPLNNTASDWTDIPLPAGIFTQTPFVIPTSLNGNYVVFANQNQSSPTSARVGARIITASSANYDVPVSVLAIQMTP